MSKITLINDDCLVWLRTQPDASIHCCVTDAPYGLKFMGKKWDYTVPSIEKWAEVLRVLKPGGTLLCFGGPKTSHRTAVNIEDAGFKLCDTLMWLHGQGMSHSLNLSKKMDKKAGATRKVIGQYTSPENTTGMKSKDDNYGFGQGDMSKRLITAPTTDTAKQWEGWHSHHLGPGYEPIIMAMKNNEGTYIENAIKWGVGGLNAQACRIPGGEVTINTFDNGAKPFGDAIGEPYTSRKSSGRFPKNLLHDGSDEVLVGFPDLGKASFAVRHRSGGKNCHNETEKPPMPDMGYGDEGSAARFFNRLGWSEDELRFMYQAKASKKEKGPDNNHPCVKPVALMRWLVRLVCPPDGVVLDPFMGSGTTGVACREEGFEFIGIERELESYETAVRRC